MIFREDTALCSGDRMKKILRTTYIIFYRLLAGGLIACAASLLILFLCGIRCYIVKTGSMEPAVPKGSVCFVNHRIPLEDIREGDIITFSAGETMLVTHRAVRIGDSGITTKGDANNTADAAKVTGDNFIGKTVFVLPYIGNAVMLAYSVRGRIVLADGFILLTAAGFLYDRLTGKHLEEEGNSADPDDAV